MPHSQGLSHTSITSLLLLHLSRLSDATHALAVLGHPRKRERVNVPLAGCRMSLVGQGPLAKSTPRQHMWGES